MSSPDVDAAAAAMYSRDATAPAFGIELVAATPAGAVVRMIVRPEMCNGLGIAHGGMVFLLADSAMAFASNAAIDGAQALATTAEIDWLSPAQSGDYLTATAELRAGAGRTRVWDVTITNQHADPIALFRGRTRTVPVDRQRP